MSEVPLYGDSHAHTSFTIQLMGRRARRLSGRSALFAPILFPPPSASLPLLRALLLSAPPSGEAGLSLLAKQRLSSGCLHSFMYTYVRPHLPGPNAQHKQNFGAGEGGARLMHKLIY